MQPICTECYIQIRKSPNDKTATCPFCNCVPYDIVYKGKKTAEERLQERVEEQRVIEVRIKAEQEQQQQQDHHSPDVNADDTQDNTESISESDVVHHSPTSEHQNVEVDQRLQNYIPNDLLQRITSGDSGIEDIEATMLDLALRISAGDQTVPSSGQHGWQQRHLHQQQQHLSPDNQSDETQQEERNGVMPSLANLFRLLMVTADTDEMMSSTLTERSSSSSSITSASRQQQLQRLTCAADSEQTLPSNESTQALDEQPESEEDLELALALSLSLSLNRTNA